MEIVVKSLNWKRPMHLDPYILGNAPTTAIPSGKYANTATRKQL